MSPSRKHHIVPPEELCCVWMTAGILSYRLCDREFECDECALDAAMRKHFLHRPESAEEASVPAPAQVPPQALREGYRYTNNHCWIRQTGHNLLQIGLEPGLSRILLSPKAVVYPTGGQTLHKGQTCMWIVLEGGTLPCDSPCDGIVRGSNHQLSENPHLIQTRPFDEGWLLEMQVEDAAGQTAGFLDADQVRPSYTACETRFRELLEGALRKGQPSVGATLADGGQLLQNIADVIGPSRYFSFVRRVYGS